MLKVGLTGGYATGKSFVAAQLAELGCFVISADKLGHAVLAPGGEAFGPAVEFFGEEILGPDGAIDRRRLGGIVFDAPEKLEQLNRFVHPAVFRLEEKMLSEFRAAHPDGIAVIEAAILVETGRHAVFERLILTVCSEETQIRRGMHRDGLTADEVRKRVDRQMPTAKKLAYADYVIDTDGPKEKTVCYVREVYEQLLSERGASA